MHEDGQQQHSSKIRKLAGNDAWTHALQHVIVQRQHAKRAQNRGVKERAARRRIALHGPITSTVQGGSWAGTRLDAAAGSKPDECRLKVQVTLIVPPEAPSSLRAKLTRKPALQVPCFGFSQSPENCKVWLMSSCSLAWSVELDASGALTSTDT